MAIPEAQREAAEFLRGISVADPIPTHISAVFLGRETAWKMKKAVAFPYLDFTTLAARHHFLRRELALNRPAAPGLYRDVVALVRGAGGGLAFASEGEAGGEAPGEAPGEPVEWVLRMARVPAGNFFDRIAEEGRLTPRLADALGRAIARYHAGLAPVSGIDHAGSLRAVVAENRAAALAAGLAEADVAAWAAAALAALEKRKAWLAERVARGFVRRAHGDLHLGNLCLWEGTPVPFDALEFDERLATIDLGYDLAFVLMDLELRRARANANRVLNAYAAESGDFGLAGGLPIFLSLRAMVRAHVQASRGRGDEARAFLAAAGAFLRPAAPMLVAVGGLPGSGKSTLAHGLAPLIGAAPGALVVANDVLRKRRHGVSPETRLHAAAYTEEENQAVQAAQLAAAGEIVRLGHAVVADATFRDPAHRAAIRTAAAMAGVRFVGICLEAPLALLEERVRARGAAAEPDPSDATEAVLHRMAASAMGDPGAGWHLLDAAGPPAATLAKAARLAQPTMEPC